MIITQQKRLSMLASISLILSATTMSLSISAWSPPVSSIAMSSIRGGSDGAFKSNSKPPASVIMKSSTSSEDTGSSGASSTGTIDNPTTAIRTNSTTISTNTKRDLLSAATTIIKSSEFQSAVAVFGGTVLTFVLNNLSGFGPIKASSVVGIISSLTLPLPLALAAFCGSFAGMAKMTVIPGLSASIILGLVCAGVMVIFDQKKWLAGVGGRLGFIAQVACTLQFVLSSLFKSFSSEAALIGAVTNPIKLLTALPTVCLFTLLGAISMSYWKEIMTDQAKKDNESAMTPFYRRFSTSVAAVGVTGLIGSLLFPASAVGPIYCGSFIAMSSPARLETYGGLIGASIMGGVCQQAMAGVLLGGWGGKLGTASLFGVLSYNWIAKMWKNTRTPAVKAA